MRLIQMTFRGQIIPKPHSTFDKHRLGGKFLDAVIRVEGVEYQVHRIILSDCSPYFSALFQFQSPVDIKVSDINGLSTDIMELIVDYAYTGKIHVTKDNVQDLMQAADMLSVTAIAEACSEFLCEQITRENCIGIWQYAKFYFYTELRDKAYRYITDHFDEIFPCEEFLYLSVQELSAILGRDDLNVRKEHTVFDAILCWIEHKPEEREMHIVELLSKFRMALTSIDYIQTIVLSNELVENSAECQLMATDAIQTIEYITQRSNLSFLRNTLARPRLPNAILLATGGWRGENPVAAICAYDIFSDSWITVPYNLEYPRAYHGTVFLKGYLYCLGGSAREEYFNSVSRLNLSTHKWNEVAPMYYSRCYVSTTELNGFIYAMGGFDGHSRLNSAERYNPDANQWKRIAPMHHPRSDASCTTLHNKVYICGGFDGNECLQTAEYYNPETNQWTLIAPMNERRSGIGVIALADQIYAVGGCDGTHRLNTTEVYNLQSNTWNFVSSMMTTRSNFGIEVIYDQIFVVGGYTGTGTTSQVEYYDSTVDRWYGASEVTYHSSALSCCVLYGLSDIANYAVPRDSLPFI